MRSKDNMSSIIINTRIVSPGERQQVYYKQFSKTKHNYYTKYGNVSSSTKVEQYTIHLPRLLEHSLHHRVAILSTHTQPCSHQRNQMLMVVMVNSYQLPVVTSARFLPLEVYPEISSNLTGSCQLETLISLTFKPLRKKKLNKFCKQFI